MVFQMDAAFALELIALVLGTALCVWVSGKEVCCKGFAKIVGNAVVLLALISMVCTTYYSFRYWKDGAYDAPHAAANANPGMGMNIKGGSGGKPGMQQMMQQRMQHPQIQNGMPQPQGGGVPPMPQTDSDTKQDE